ncbi:hypothetical protein BC834DRAFT_889357 [Gloeopeniophorella convolvens]|nr:hypothetical protein BC834DRAFT_889357 [Gloeopeniophorella convolvens]
MGTSWSRAARMKPTQASVKTPPWAGARTPTYDPISPPISATRKPWASESKSEAIQEDARDPQLIANLTQLGPVRVDQHMQTIQTEARFKQLFQSRAQSEDEALNPHMLRNRLLTSTLVTLLEGRLNSGTKQEFGRLAQKHGIDPERLEAIAQHVNVPQVREGGIVRVLEQNGEETVIKEVEWQEPAVQSAGV